MPQDGACEYRIFIRGEDGELELVSTRATDSRFHSTESIDLAYGFENARMVVSVQGENTTTVSQPNVSTVEFDTACLDHDTAWVSGTLEFRCFNLDGYAGYLTDVIAVSVEDDTRLLRVMCP
jgi:hypothetical protein